MRVISQDGTLDFPYELSAIRINNEVITMTMCEGTAYSNVIAKYSTEEKAIKAMEMLREQYKGLEVLKILASGAVEHMGKTLKNDELVECNRAYRDMNVFQFPQDDEIEV